MLYKLRQILKSIMFSIPLFRGISVAYSVKHRLLPSIFTKLQSDELRLQLFLPPSQFVTQLNQDVFALLVNHFKAGFFIEIGANDGFTLSNTVYLERHFGWEGLLIEANPKYAESLARRNAKTVMLAILEEAGKVNFRDAGLYGGVEATLDNANPGKTKDCEVITVSGVRLLSVLEDFKAPKLIDFISIDVEGGELPIVKQLCEIKEFRFKSGCIEHNLRMDDYHDMKSQLTQAGYLIVWEGQTQHDLFFVDSLNV